MNRFYHSLTYRFLAEKGGRKHYFFDLVDRTWGEATFRLRDKDCKFPVTAQIIVDNSSDVPTETAKFTYKGVDFELRADFFIGKGYNMTPADRRKKQEDKLKDLHLHTSLNADEIKAGKECGCIYCQRIFPTDEVVDFVDEGEAALCPYCDIDAVIVAGPNVEVSKEILTALHKKYF